MIELLVAIAIVAILAATLFPVFAKAWEKARQASYQSNPKQIGLAIRVYARDHDDRLPLPRIGMDTYQCCGASTPHGARWFSRTSKNGQLFICLSVRGWGTCKSSATVDVKSTYGMTAYLCPWYGAWQGPDGPHLELASIQQPAELILVGEGRFADHNPYCHARSNGPTNFTGNGCYLYPHNNTENLLFADGHVKAMKFPATIEPKYLWWDPGWGTSPPGNQIDEARQAIQNWSQYW